MFKVWNKSLGLKQNNLEIRLRNLRIIELKSSVWIKT